MASSSRSSTARAATSTRRSARPTSCCRRISIAFRHSFPATSTATSCTAAGRATRRGLPRPRLPPSRSCAARASRNVGLLFVVGEERGSDGAKAAQALASGSKFLINGEPTDNRLGIGTRGALRYNLRAKGRAAHSSFPELGVSAIEKLIDALVMMRTMEMPEHPVLGPHALHGGAHQGWRRAERHSVRSGSRSDVPHGCRRRGTSRADDAADAARHDRGDSRRAAGDHADGSRLRDRDVSRTRPTFRFSPTGARRCSTVPAPSTSRTPTTSTSRSRI